MAKKPFAKLLAIMMAAAIAAAPAQGQVGPFDLNFRVKLDTSTGGATNPGGGTNPGGTNPPPATPNADMRVTIFGPLQGRINEPFQMTAAAENAPAEPVAWQPSADSAPIPAGLGIDPATGTISGQRQVAGLTPVLKIRASATSKQADSAPFRILFRAAGATGTASISAGNGVVGTSYLAQGNTADMDGTPVWSLASGTLPPGLTLSSTGRISGVPETAGTYSGISLVATGPSDAAIAGPFTITVTNPSTTALSVTAQDATGNVSSNLRAAAVATGGTKPYTFSLASGTLPPGLEFKSTGVIEGVPTTTGVWTGITIAVTDAASANATASLTITIGTQLPFRLTAPTPSYATVGAFKSIQASPTNAQGGVTYALSSGTLPPGMALSASGGDISGIPTTAGTYPGIVVTGTDESSATASTSPITVIVDPQPPFTVSVPSGTVPYNTLRTFQATASEAATYSYAWDTDYVASVPAGVALNASTGQINVQRNIAGTTGYLRIQATQVSGPNAGRTVKSNPFYYNVESTGTFEIVMPDEIGPATVGEPYSIAFASRGAGGTGPVTGPLTWSTTYALPAGLTLNAETGRIEGTPTTATASWSWTRVKATDAMGRTASSPDFWMRAADKPVLAWDAGYPQASYKVRRSFLLRARFQNPSPSLAKVDTWAYRSWESLTANRRIVNARGFISGAGSLVNTITMTTSTVDANMSRTRYSGQPGYAMGWSDTRISQVGDPNDMGRYTVTLNYEDARGTVAKTDPATFDITGPLKLVNYISNPASDRNFTVGSFYGTCSYGATYVPAGVDGVEGLDEIRVIAVPNSSLSLDPVFENDPNNTAMPYFDQKPWPGGNNNVPELPGQSGAPGRHLALGGYGHGAAIPNTQAPGFYKNLVGIYDGEVDVYTYYNVKTMLNPGGTGCNTTTGVWNF